MPLNLDDLTFPAKPGKPEIRSRGVINIPLQDLGRLIQLPHELTPTAARWVVDRDELQLVVDGPPGILPEVPPGALLPVMEGVFDEVEKGIWRGIWKVTEV